MKGVKGMKAYAGTAALALWAGGVVVGQETVLPDMVVSATGFETSRLETGFSTTVITADDIAQRGWTTLPEALRGVPGLHIAQHGGPGSTVSIILRGSRTGQVLVLLDGVRLNDPSSPTREAEIADIDLASVERIEVLRGPQSGLYGADAAAGVINIITRRAPRDTQAVVSLEGGSYNTWRASGRVGGTAGRLAGNASATWLRTDGFSAANTRFPGNRERDGFEQLTLDARLRATLTDAAGVDAFIRYQDAEIDYDDGAGPFADADNTASVERLMAGFGADMAGEAPVAWQSRLAARYSATDRVFEDTWGRTTFDGTQWEADWRQDIALDDRHRITAGVTYHRETAEGSSLDKVSAYNTGLYLQHHLTWGAFAAVTGLRHDEHEAFGGETTWRAAPSYAIAATGTRLLGSVGTAFKAPSLFQLFAPESPWGPVGNAELDPETAFGWEAGFEQTLADGILAFGATYFNSTVDDQIEFINGYENVSQVDVSGVESFVRVTPVAALAVEATYTRTKAEAEGTRTQLIRVPKDRATLDIRYRPMPTLTLSGHVLHVGSRNDRYFDNTMFTSVDAEAGSYTVFNLAAAFDVRDHVTVFARIDNLFDKDYEEIYGFGTPGLSGYAGLSVRL